MKGAYSKGVAPGAKCIRLNFGNVHCGIGFGDFSAAEPRWAYIGRIANPNRDWTFLARIWNIGFQIHKVRPPK